MAEGGNEASRVDEGVVGSSEVKALERRIRGLERVLDNKTLENEILREAVKAPHEKNFSHACRHCPTRVRCEDGRRQPRPGHCSIDNVNAQDVLGGTTNVFTA